MNVYDFDKTIYDGDSSIDFTIFCFKNYPITLKYINKQLKGILLFLLGVINKTEMKEMLFSYIHEINDMDLVIDQFWNKNISKIKFWYLKQKKDNDLIISASPDFIIGPICKKLNVNYIASKVDIKQSKFKSLNCFGVEKVNRLKEKYSLEEVEYVYSDSYSDQPLADISKVAYMVKGNDRILWNNYKPSRLDKIKEIFLNMQFIIFIFCGCINVINGILFAWVYSLIFEVNLAFCLGYLTSLVISYYINSKLTFHKSLSIKRFIKFAISYIPNFIIQNIIVFFMYYLLTIPKLLSYGGAAIIGVPITFIMMKYFAFTN